MAERAHKKSDWNVRRIHLRLSLDETWNMSNCSILFKRLLRDGYFRIKDQKSHHRTWDKPIQNGVRPVGAPEATPLNGFQQLGLRLHLISKH
jgi:hypothetical protein